MFRERVFAWTDQPEHIVDARILLGQQMLFSFMKLQYGGLKQITPDRKTPVTTDIGLYKWTTLRILWAVFAGK